MKDVCLQLLIRRTERRRQKRTPLDVSGARQATRQEQRRSKAVIVFQGKRVPPNLHYHEPNLALTGLRDGSMRPVTRATPLDPKFIPVNCFGFGGANTHLITAHPAFYDARLDRPLQQRLTTDAQPLRLILLSGRTDQALAHLLSSLKTRPQLLTRSSVAGFRERGRSPDPPHLVSRLPLLTPVFLFLIDCPDCGDSCREQ